MKKSRLLGAVCALCVFTSLPTLASPWGTNYGVTLDGVVDPSVGIPPEMEDIEGHDGIVTFDGIPDLITNDLVPGPPAFPGNDLWVTEDAVTNPDGSETISIWIESEGDSCPELLFCNPLDLTIPVFLEIYDLYWVEGPAAVISDIELLLTFFPGDPGIPIIPMSENILGSGSISDPLFMFFELDPFDFEGCLGPGAIGPVSIGCPTDLHLNFTVSHVPVPPALWLFGSGLLGLVGISRRKKVA